MQDAKSPRANPASELAMVVLETIVPVLLLIALGKFLALRRVFSDGFFRELNRLTYFWGLPALLLYKVAAIDLQNDSCIGILNTLMIVTALCIAAAYLCVFAFKIPKNSIGAFVHGSYRGNLAFVGFPVVFFALGQEGLDLAMFASGICILVYNISGVLILVLHAKERPKNPLQALWKHGLSNPFILACALGFALHLLDLAIPLMARRSLEALGNLALHLQLKERGTLTFTFRGANYSSYTTFTNSLKLNGKTILHLLDGQSYTLNIPAGEHLLTWLPLDADLWPGDTCYLDGMSNQSELKRGTNPGRYDLPVWIFKDQLSAPQILERFLNHERAPSIPAAAPTACIYFIPDSGYEPNSHSDFYVLSYLPQGIKLDRLALQQGTIDSETGQIYWKSVSLVPETTTPSSVTTSPILARIQLKNQAYPTPLLRLVLSR